MSNRGWSNGGGESVDSTTRQSGAKTNCSAADQFVHGGSRIATRGPANDPLENDGDLFEVPGNLSES